MKVHFIQVSQNAKTGPIPVSIIERASCWPGCALYGNGCYAEAGALAMHWARVSRGPAGGSWSEFCGKIAALRPSCLWRYAQAGDLPGYDPMIHGKLLEEPVAANAGKNAITFIHKPVLGDDPVAVESGRVLSPRRPWTAPRPTAGWGFPALNRTLTAFGIKPLKEPDIHRCSGHVAQATSLDMLSPIMILPAHVCGRHPEPKLTTRHPAA